MKRGWGWLRLLTAIALATSLVAASAVALAGYGYRWGWWALSDGFRLLLDAFYFGCAGLVLGLLLGILCLILRRRGLATVALLAVLIGGGALVLPVTMRLQAESAPRIHDITTDFVTPPAFVALQKMRDGLPNGSAYGGSIVADQQRSGYPDIAPVLLKLPPDQAMKKSLEVAQAMGWQIVARDAAQFEATATTPWFGFKDDIVIRVQPDVAGSRIDVRSASRIGTSDLGTNARRVRETIERLKR